MPRSRSLRAVIAAVFVLDNLYSWAYYVAARPPRIPPDVWRAGPERSPPA